MQAEKLQKFESRLLDLRKRLRNEIQSRVDTVPQKTAATGDVSDVPTHAADHDVEGLESEVAAGDTQKRELDAVQTALHRVEAGTYGRCEKCDGEIDEARLEALPYTAMCKTCAEKAQSGEI